MNNNHVPESLLISVNDFCKLTSIGRTAYFTARAGGRIGPAEIKIGSKILFRRVEVEAWINAGCPPRRQWNWRGMKS